MKNLDDIKQRKEELLSNVASALKDGNEEDIKKYFQEYSAQVSAEIVAQAQSVMDNADNAVLSTRGLRTLTSKETTYYQKLITAMQSSSPKQAISNIDEAFPETIFESILEDIRTEHPLLNAIDFSNTSILTKWIVNKQDAQLAVWGPINSEITKELEGAIGTINLDMCKLSAFMVVSQDMLKLGPRWIDAYVREIMKEAIALSLETAIVDGTGKDEPIGMTRDVSEDVSVTSGVYPRKEAIAVERFNPETYGTLIEKLTLKPNGSRRDVQNLILVVNPADYFKTIMPGTTMLTPNGSYVNNVLPYPTQIIKSVAVPEGYAVLGLAKRYFMGIGSSKDGVIDTSDEYRFLEDERTYKIKMHGNGMPLDDNAFLYLDISGLKAPYFEVSQIA